MAKTALPNTFVKVAGLGLLSFVCAFFGAWAAIKSGVVSLGDSASIAEKRTVVSSEGDVVADVAKKVSSSVVSVITESQASLGFRTYTQQGAGTGVVITKDGLVLTNKHVVSGASSVKVISADGTEYSDVKVVGTDPANDIAFLKVSGVTNFSPATMGDSSKVEVGQKVIAIGNALGQYQTSVTSGIISGLGRPIVAGDSSGVSSESLNNLIQTDAAINPGNSGGPLVNLSGEVIGINTAVDQQAEGIGFAIPINDARGLINSVTKNGKVERAYLGVSHMAITPDVKKYYKLNESTGAYIVNEDGPAVASGSPAEKAGLKSGDVIVSLGGVTIDAKHPLMSVISQRAPGETLPVVYMRDGKKESVNVTLGVYPTQ